MGVMGHIIVIDRGFHFNAVSLLLRMSDKGKEQKLIEMRGGEHILAQFSITVIDDLDTRRDRKPVKPQKYTSTMQLWHIYLLDNTNFQKKSTTAGSY